MKEYISTHPCVDCGISDPVVLELDHRDPTQKKIEVPRCGTITSVRDEAAKCDVRCANCHRKRHAKFGLKAISIKTDTGISDGLYMFAFAAFLHRKVKGNLLTEMANKEMIMGSFVANYKLVYGTNTQTIH